MPRRYGDYGDLYIRRDRSSLARGEIFRGRPRRTSSVLLVLIGIALICAALVFWQLPVLQPAVLSLFGSGQTPTPTILESARAGELAFYQGNLNEAIAHYRRAVAIAPSDVDVVYELVRMLIYRSWTDDRNVQDVEEAKQLALQLTLDAPNSTRALALNCYALVRAGQSEEALQYCNRAINLNPTDADAHAYLAQAYLDLGRYENASEAGRKALQLNPDSIEGNTAFAYILVSLQRADQAIEYLKRAAQTNPRLEYPYYNLAGVALSVGLQRNDEVMKQLSVKAYDQILTMNKRSVKAFTGLCRTYFALGEQNLARDNCQTATSLDDTYTPAWRWLGEINYRLSEYELAVTALDTCIAKEKNIPATQRQSECWVYGGLAYVQMGNCPVALPILEEVLNWTRSTRAIQLVNEGIRICTGVRRGPEPTPTSGS